jgi:vacuolar-type H+-ATPase subunit I/STV1
MGKYEEAIYDRFEQKFSSVKTMTEYLDSFGGRGGGNAYELDALRVAERIRAVDRIEGEIVSTKEYDDLEKLKRETKSLPDYLDSYKSGLINGIEVKQKRISDELKKIAEENKKAALERESKEKELVAEEKDIEREEQIETTEVEKESVKELQQAEKIASSLPTKEERDILLRQAQLESDRLKEERLRDVQRTSEDKRKRLNAKRQLLKIEQRKNR